MTQTGPDEDDSQDQFPQESLTSAPLEEPSPTSTRTVGGIQFDPEELERAKELELYYQRQSELANARDRTGSFSSNHGGTVSPGASDSFNKTTSRGIGTADVIAGGSNNVLSKRSNLSPFSKPSGASGRTAGPKHRKNPHNDLLNQVAMEREARAARAAKDAGKK
jgi:hypothetical protein